ncbi:MAG: hypothetical protein SGPRY_001205, partial [Prymnesium sp.]
MGEGDLRGLLSQVSLSPLLGMLYPTAARVEHSPEEGRLGSPHFGWRNNFSPLVITFEWRYKPGMQAEVQSRLSQAISFNQ